MKRWIRSMLCFCLILVLTTIAAPIHASQTDGSRVEGVQPYFTYINVFQNTFDILNSGNASITVLLTATGVDQVEVTAYLQQFKDGYWSTIKSWSNTKNSTSCGLGVNWYVVSGYSYRLVSYGYTYKSGVLVEGSSYTSTIIKY